MVLVMQKPKYVSCSAPPPGLLLHILQRMRWEGEEVAASMAEVPCTKCHLEGMAEVVTVANIRHLDRLALTNWYSIGIA